MSGAEERLRAVLAPDIVAAVLELVDERVAGEFARLAPAANGDRRWLTLDEAGERLGVTAAAVRMRVNRGRLEARRQGRRLYVSSESVDRLA